MSAQGGSTLAPTWAPTLAPTWAPTLAPTWAPTSGLHAQVYISFMQWLIGGVDFKSQRIRSTA